MMEKAEGHTRLLIAPALDWHTPRTSALVLKTHYVMISK